MKVPRFVNLFWRRWMSYRAFELPPPADLAPFLGDEITHRGVRLKVAKVVGGPTPVLLLTPLGLSKREWITRGQRFRGARRRMLRDEQAARAAIARELRGK